MGVQNRGIKLRMENKLDNKERNIHMNTRTYKQKLLVLLLILATLIPTGCLEEIHANEEYTDVTVTKKFVDNSKEGSHYILVTDKGNFEVDRPIIDRLNNSRNPDTVYGTIIEGEQYKLHHYGYRIDFLYEYPFVVDAVPI